MDNNQQHIHHYHNDPHVLRRNWAVAMCLAFFGGWLGLDAFYLGKNGKGIIKFFTVGCFGILWLVDFIQIATKSVRGVVWDK